MIKNRTMPCSWMAILLHYIAACEVALVGLGLATGSCRTPEAKRHFKQAAPHSRSVGLDKTLVDVYV
jgi:hypothetical protein